MKATRWITAMVLLLQRDARMLCTCGMKAIGLSLQKKNNHLAEGAVLEEGSVYSWEKAVYGGTSLLVWTTLKGDDIVTLQASWRFGPATCEYLRAAHPKYDDSAAGLWSPLDESMQKSFREAELKRVPETVHRLVVCKGDTFYYSENVATCCL